MTRYAVIYHTGYIKYNDETKKSLTSFSENTADKASSLVATKAARDLTDTMQQGLDSNHTLSIFHVFNFHALVNEIVLYVYIDPIMREG